jgi:hypothetical protein
MIASLRASAILASLKPIRSLILTVQARTPFKEIGCPANLEGIGGSGQSDQ